MLPSMSDPFRPAPITLDGRFVRVEPLERRHAPDFARTGADPAIWRWMPGGPPDGAHREERTRWFDAWIERALDEQERAEGVPFAIRRHQDGLIVGSTRYLTIRPDHRSIEIGWTWLAPDAQRTPVNTETKLLLLAHAFETLGARRVEFKTDARNARSRRALERIGGTFEGVLRRHMIRPDGSPRDSAYYSIIDDEWPPTRTRIRGLLDRPSP